MNVIDRFIKYCKFETTSKDEVNVVPSTESQRALALHLAQELKEMGVEDVVVTAHCYVYGKIRGNVEGAKKLGLIAHLDTSPSAGGKSVTPIIRHYNGGDLKLEHCTIELSKNLELNDYVGQNIITSQGDTLLGCDDKGGIAIIMSVAEQLVNDKTIPHGQISIAFTPDEEVGNGTEFFEIETFDADFAYTVDGGKLGEIEFENFNAGCAKIAVNGKSFHPGDSKGKMVNANLILAELIELLPKDQTPATTEKYEGFYFVESIVGECSKSYASVLIRDHDIDKFNKRKEFVEKTCEYLNEKYGKDTVECKITDTYYNMKNQILPHFHLIEDAKTAMSNCQVEPIVVPIRGGTDGARLSYMGLPCPNISTGGHNFHGNQEYVPTQSLEKMVDVVIEILKLQAKRK